MNCVESVNKMYTRMKSHMAVSIQVYDGWIFLTKDLWVDFEMVDKHHICQKSKGPFRVQVWISIKQYNSVCNTHTHARTHAGS